MLRISRLTDYSTLIMHKLALAPDKTHSATGLAESLQLATPTVSKVLKMLHESALVTAIRGASGGYKLARPASEISITEIIKAIEGRLALTECGATPGTCQLEEGCSIRHNWQIISLAILNALQNISLADMTKPLTSLKGNPLITEGLGLDKLSLLNQATTNIQGLR